MRYSLISVCMLSLLYLTGCTYAITMVHTEGTASDVVDDQHTPSITANIPLNGTGVPAVTIAPTPATMSK